MKAEPNWLIPQKFVANLELSIVELSRKNAIEYFYNLTKI